MSRNHYKGVPKHVDLVESLESLSLAERSTNARVVLCPTLTVGTTETMCCWVKNESTDKEVVLSKSQCSWNGGNTNHNRVLFAHSNVEVSEPIDHFTELDIFPPTEDVTVYVWDGVGAGMVSTSSGIRTTTHMLSQGVTEIDTSDVVVLGPGESVGCINQGEEAGKTSCLYFAYLRSR